MKYPTCLLSVTKDIGGIKSLSDVFVALQLSFGSVGDAIAKMAAAASSGAGVFGTLSAGAAALSGTLVPIVAIAAAVAAGIYAISKAYVSASEANDKMRDSYSAYQEAQSNLESVNSELDTTKASMDELLGKEHLTFVEEAELQKLKDATEQLLIQQDLAEREENKAARQAAEDTVSAYKKNFKNEISASQTKERQDYAQMTGNNAGLTVEPTDVSSMLAAIKQFDALKQEAKDELAKAQKDGNENDIKWLEEDIQHYDDLNQDLTDSIWDQVKLLTEYRDTLKALPEEELAKVDGASDVLTQDIANNKSTIKWTLKGSGSYSGWVRVSEVRIKIDGSQVFYRDSSHHTDAYNGTQICSGSKTLNHNADGSKSFSISVEAGIYEWAINKSKSKTFSLNVIPRASSISCGTLTMGSAGTISVSRASTSFTHTITYLYGTKSGTICTKSSSTSVSWTPPLDLAHMVPNATSGVGTLYCDTYNGNTKIGSKSISFTCNVPASVKPSCSISSLTNTNSTFGCYAKLLSGVKVKPSASGSYSSTISSLKISVTGMSDKTASSGTEYTFDPFTSTGEKTITSVM